MITGQSIELFEKLARDSRRYVLTTHVNPDGDAIGSQFGLARYLATRGASITIINQDATPPTLEFLEDPSLVVEVYEPGRHDDVLRRADLVVLLDNSAPDRLGEMEALMIDLADKVLCIDHHPTRVTPWVHNILDERACATAAIIYELIRGLDWEPDPRTAEALYVGLATDTGFFRFNSTTPRAYEIAADLMRAGADPARCYQGVYERNSLAYTRLLGKALTGVRLDAGGAVASVRVTRQMVEDCAAGEEDTSEMTTSLLAMDGVRIAILFREIGEGKIKVSLRSKGNLDVRFLATRFGGGGHRNASGIVLAGNLDGVAAEVLEKAAELVADSL
jgi:phosphoesterase RecJ-like protein